MKKKLFRALRLAAAPFKLLLLLVPLVGLMVYVNYTVDCSGLYQGDLTNRTIVELLLQGENVSGFSQMDQRAVLELYIQLLPDEQVPETVALGSSRVMQLTTDMAGTTLYNCGVTGGDYRDMMNAFYLWDKYGKLPDRVVLGIDPWMFRSDVKDKRSNAALFEEMLSVALGHFTSYQAPQPSRLYRLCDAAVQKATKGQASLTTLNVTDETLLALFEPAYFQGNVQHYRKTRNQSVMAEAVTEDGIHVVYRAVTPAQMRTNTDEVKCADGTVWYSQEFREASADAALQVALTQAGTFLYMEGYTELETAQCTLFEEFIEYVQSRGVEVVFFLAPYHPFLYEYVTLYNYDDHAGFFEVEPYVRTYAAKKGIPVVGSYDPRLLGLKDEDFFDGLHVRAEGIAKYFGGFDAAGGILPGTEYDGVALCPLVAEEDAETDAANAPADTQSAGRG